MFVTNSGILSKKPTKEIEPKALQRCKETSRDIERKVVSKRKKGYSRLTNQ